ncbi:patatin-like phospholipase family protein [Actinopolymorpha sp. B9G3]|uniref:patatin-like phospholipase family protein n=1 Tax=Actinopolymorpha sp. B9G3 TaxID=3158970 RepID=UPI0032D9444F
MAEARKADLVLEGGGVKGIGLVGALHELDRAGYEFPRVAGTSAGAVAGALVAAGMPMDELQKIMLEVDYRKFCDKSPLDRIPVVGKSLSMLVQRGIYEGDYLQEWLGRQLEKQGVKTFADLQIDDPDATLAEDQRFSLVVMATDLTLGQLVRLPWDYRRIYGLDPRTQPVVDAVRASMSIPFFFEPFTLTNPKTGMDSTLVDGGVLSNFPIDAFDRTDGQPPRWPTFGIKLLPTLPKDNTQLLPVLGQGFRKVMTFPRPWVLGIPQLPPIRLLTSLVATTIAGHDQTRLNLPWVDARTIRVDTTPAGIVEFDLDGRQLQRLYDNGRKAAKTFLRHWNWQDYLTRYRQPAAAPAGPVPAGVPDQREHGHPRAGKVTPARNGRTRRAPPQT